MPMLRSKKRSGSSTEQRRLYVSPVQIELARACCANLTTQMTSPQSLIQRATKKMLKEKEKLRQRKKKAPAAERLETVPAERKRRVAFA